MTKTEKAALVNALIRKLECAINERVYNHTRNLLRLEIINAGYALGILRVIDVSIEVGLLRFDENFYAKLKHQALPHSKADIDTATNSLITLINSSYLPD